MQELEVLTLPVLTRVAGPRPLTRRADTYAFFLDLDGTLLEFAPSPQRAAADAELLDLLQTLALHSHGAVAVLSGRSIANVDALLSPLRLPASGLHGFERRTAQGVRVECRAPARRTLEDARRLLSRVAALDPGLMLEDKRFALALHYRQAPHLEELIISAVKAVAEEVGDGLALLRGPMVAELSPSGVNKATALAGFMAERPFKGRRPLFLGDDLTDEPAFQWVNAAGGLSVAVNVMRPTAAAIHLPSVSAVRSWLRRMMGWRARWP